MNVEVIFDSSFSDEEQEIADCFVGFLDALVDGDTDVLDGILSDNFVGIQLPSMSQSRSEFLSSVSDGALDVSGCDMFSLEIDIDGDEASLAGKIRLTAKVQGRQLRWISNTVAGFVKVDGKWLLAKWEY